MNLIEMLKSEVSSDVISSLSQKAGVSEEQAKAGFSTGIPAVLAGILKNGSGPSAGFIANMLNPSPIGGDNQPEDVLKGSNDSLLEKGKSLVSGLFGNDSGAVTNALSSSSGLSMEKSSGLLAMAIPVITGIISKMMTSKMWRVSDLLGKIFESKSDLIDALPKGLGDSLGLTNIHLPKVEVPKTPPVNYATIKESKSAGGFLKWLIPLLIVLIGAWWIMGRSGCNKTKLSGTNDSTVVDTMANMDTTKTVIKTVSGKLNEAGDFVRDLGASINKKLPNGTAINIAENSVENQLISFIEDKNRPVDKTTWFTFDRLYFDSGKSTLKAESQAQLKNIAAILKAYPNVKLKLGGYTDNVGEAAMNMKLSTNRANSAMQELVTLGVDAKRLEAEGYGQEHPIAGNDTPEGKAQNRRIDVRVTQK